MANIPRSVFTDTFVRLNRLEEFGFGRWLFPAGMEFGTRQQWWQGKGARPTPHEGLDICCFENRDGEIVYLHENSLVPAMYDGTVVKIFTDFLSLSVMVGHPFEENGKNLYSIYAHIIPQDTLQPGSRVKAGDMLGTTCTTKIKSMNPHLHLTVLWALVSVIPGLDWQNINQAADVVLCDPVDFL